MPKKWLLVTTLSLIVFYPENSLGRDEEGSRCRPEGVFAPNPLDCNSFLMCNHGKYILRPCQVGIIQDFMYKFGMKPHIDLVMDFLIDGQISSFCPDQLEVMFLTLIMLHKLTQSL